VFGRLLSVTKEGEDRLAAARSQYSRARSAILTDRATPEAARDLRQSLVSLRSAMDWLEHTPLFDEAHHLLDEAGAFARAYDPAGCHLTYEDSVYFQECPVALGHNRVALSPELFVREADCSICQAAMNQCGHVPGVIYDGTECHRIVKDLNVLDVMFVGRPAQPDARIHRMSIETSRLEESLGDEFYPGIPVMCDRCISPCGGVVRNFDAD
jgi:hypothetical protein